MPASTEALQTDPCVHGLCAFGSVFSTGRFSTKRPSCLEVPLLRASDLPCGYVGFTV